MTWVTDDTGTRWVEYAPRPRRKSARALRFGPIKVGDQVMRRWGNLISPGSSVWHYIVSDLWFDPVAGQRDDTAGRMVALQRINPRTGEIETRKEPHTIRGLASQGFQFSGRDYIAETKARANAMATGEVTGIGMAHVIRRRPKIAGGLL